MHFRLFVTYLMRKNGVTEANSYETANDVRKILKKRHEMTALNVRLFRPVICCRIKPSSFPLSYICAVSFIQYRPQLDAPSDWRPGGRGFNPRRGRQHSFVEIDYEIFSTVILSLPLIQKGQLSVSGERMCTILINRLED